jgi:hypothetical protein
MLRICCEWMGSGLEGFTGKWVTIWVEMASTLYAVQGSQLFLIQQRIISCFEHGNTGI